MQRKFHFAAKFGYLSNKLSFPQNILLEIVVKISLQNIEIMLQDFSSIKFVPFTYLHTMSSDMVESAEIIALTNINHHSKLFPDGYPDRSPR